MGKQLVKIIKEICSQEKIKFKTYSSDYILQLEANKRIMYIFGNKFPNNNAGTEQICNDKSALSDILDFNNIPHVPHYFFNSPLLEEYCSSSGNWNNMSKLLKKYNIVVCKNNRGTGGNNIYKASNQKELESAVLKILKSSNSICISPFYNIEDEFRVVMVGGEFQYAFKKIRPFIIGNGIDTIAQLWEKESKWKDVIFSEEINWNSIPSKGEKIQLTWKHNLGQGAIPELVTDEELKSRLGELANHCVSVLQLGFVSIDIIKVENDFKVLEINSGVMIENFSKYSTEYYNLSKNAIKAAIFSFLHLDTKYQLTRTRKSHFVLPVLTQIAKKKGIKIIDDKQEKNFAIFSFPNGKNFVARDYPFNINSGGSIALCVNKSACNSFIKELGFSTPLEKYFVKKPNIMVTLNEIEKHLVNPELSLGFTYPIVVKPNDLTQGIGVFVAYNKEECLRYVQAVFSTKSKILLLQEYCSGNEYRIVVLNGEILQAYQRKPFHVVGDGKSTIADLIQVKINAFKKYGRDKEVDMRDPRIMKHILQAGYSLDSILEKDTELRLQTIANLSLGGESIDVIDYIDNDFKQIAIEIAKKLNLCLCGIDIIINDIKNIQKGYHILEVNSSPGLDNYLYNDKKTQQKYVEHLYTQVFETLENL